MSKNLLKTIFGVALAAVFLLGLSTVMTTPAEAVGGACPPCYVPDGAPGWTQVGSCVYGPPHCPSAYKLYRNDYTSQLCRGQFGVANL